MKKKIWQYKIPGHYNARKKQEVIQYDFFPPNQYQLRHIVSLVLQPNIDYLSICLQIWRNEK